jgi:prepilin-type N-terminal cleavage/methylation domain-containing protein
MICKSPNDRRGFSLLELLVVMAVLVLLAAIAVPTIDGMYGHVRMSAAVDTVKGIWAEARTNAIDDGVPYRFSVIPGEGKCRLAPDRAEFWSGGESSTEGGVVIQSELPNGISFSSSSGDAASDWVAVAIFMPDGSCQDDVEMTLRGQGYAPVSMHIRGLTGVVTVQTLRESP